VLGIQETVMLVMLLVVGLGYLIDRFAPGMAERRARKSEPGHGEQP
jgi:hypothetical protein